MQVVANPCADLTPLEAWDLKSGRLAGTLTGHTRPIFSLEYTADGSHIISGSEDKTVRVWDVRSHSNCVVLQLDDGCVSISVSPDFSHVFAGTLNGKLVSWRMNLCGIPEAGAETSKYTMTLRFAFTPCAKSMESSLAVAISLSSCGPVLPLHERAVPTR